MARPQINNAEYFPHFTSMRNHRKVKILRNKFGQVVGYAFWSMLVEYLTEHDGLEFEYSELECEIFASELGVSAAEIPTMIDFCLKIELLFKSPSGFIYSDSLNEYLQPVFDKRHRERDRSKVRKRRENGTYIPTNGGISVAETPQSKVKESKVEVSKDTISLSETPAGVQTDTQVGVLKEEVKQDVVKESATAKAIRTLPERRKQFGEKVKRYVKSADNPNGIVSREMGLEFFDYWTEPNKSNSKMLFETKNTWDLNLRIQRWANNPLNNKGKLSVVSQHNTPMPSIDHSNTPPPDRKKSA